MEENIGRVFPGWQVEELLGAGAFGKVYKARREVMGHVSYAAVKVIQIPGEKSEVNELLNSGMDSHSIHSFYEDMVRNLMNEIQIMESLKTADNIVSIEDFQVLDNADRTQWQIFIRMELLTNLGDYLQNHTMTRDEIIRLGINICSALESCENVNIIHRDIKIDNVFVNEFGSFKLGDFGISKQLEQTTSALSQKGTNMYMAPEVYRGEKYGNTVDIYSLGIMLYRLCRKGRFPFLPPVPQPLHPGDYHTATARRLNGENIPMPEGVDARLGEVLCRACAFRAEDRFQSAAEMKRELQRCLKAETPPVSPVSFESVVPEEETSEVNFGMDSRFAEPERTSAAFSQIAPRTDQEAAQGAGNGPAENSPAKKQGEKEENGKKRRKNTKKRTEKRSRGKGGLGKIIAIIAIVVLAAGGTLFGIGYYRNIQTKQENSTAQVKEFLKQVTVASSNMGAVIGGRAMVITLHHLAETSIEENGGNFDVVWETMLAEYNTDEMREILPYLVNDEETALVSLSDALSKLNTSEEMEACLEKIKKADAQIENMIPEIEKQGEVKGVSKQELLELYNTYHSISIEYTQISMGRQDANEILNDFEDFNSRCNECMDRAKEYEKKVQ